MKYTADVQKVSLPIFIDNGFETVVGGSTPAPFDFPFNAKREKVVIVHNGAIKISPNVGLAEGSTDWVVIAGPAVTELPAGSWSIMRKDTGSANAMYITDVVRA